MNKCKFNLKILFCYVILFVSIFLFCVILIKKPTKNLSLYLYNTGKDIDSSVISFPYEQNIFVDSKNISSVTISLFDSMDINNYNYKIYLVDKNNNTIFFHDFVDYDSPIIYMYFGDRYDLYNSNLKLKIECDDCNNVKMATGSSLDKNKNYSTIKDNKILPTVVGVKKFNSRLFWYPIFGVIIFLILIVLAKEDKLNEKK